MPSALPIIALFAVATANGEADRPEERPWSLDLTVHDFGVGIGNSRRVEGLRLNFRDTAPFTVHGINLTVWSPAEDVTGSVDGIALGLPVTGATTIRGLALGFGFGADRELDGLGVAILGGGSGGALRGVFAGGLGFGTGGDIDGIAVGGLGIGCGGDVRGLLVGGLGAGCGRDLAGAAIGGLGVGVGGRVRGLVVGGLGAGAGGGIDGIGIGGLGIGSGGDLRGIALGGLGVGVSGSLKGVALGGLGVGAGGSIEGVAIAGLGVGAPRIRGFVAALSAGGQDIVGVALAPAYSYVDPKGSLTGLSVSAFNHIRGEQHGVAIGILNYTPSLHGLQLGLVNWAGNNATGLKLLPIANAHFD